MRSSTVMLSTAAASSPRCNVVEIVQILATNPPSLRFKRAKASRFHVLRTGSFHLVFVLFFANFVYKFNQFLGLVFMPYEDVLVIHSRILKVL